LNQQDIPLSKIHEIITKLLNKTDSLGKNPFLGQKEEYLEHLDKDHRRLIEGHFKIIYRIEDDKIYVTDFFDTRQDPNNMKG
jgi:plasmid stabilization system protein ParE